jgi:hypothetical protein
VPDAAPKRFAPVPKFRIFYFRDSVLDHAEEVEAGSVVDAVATIAGKPPEVRAEIWSDSGRVGIIGASRGAMYR